MKTSRNYAVFVRDLNVAISVKVIVRGLFTSYVKSV